MSNGIDVGKGGGGGCPFTTMVQGLMKFTHDALEGRVKFRQLQREFLKTRFSRCMLFRQNAAIGTD